MKPIDGDMKQILRLYVMSVHERMESTAVLLAFMSSVVLYFIRGAESLMTGAPLP